LNSDPIAPEDEMALAEKLPQADASSLVDRDLLEGQVQVELRFLGSPTIRVDGRDVEPGAEERQEFVLSCRVYRTERGLAGQPDEAWIREALTGAGR
jgi:hypothetical protein